MKANSPKSRSFDSRLSSAKEAMIIQGLGYLDDVDKELNIYAMRVREWYGWHFPELSEIVQDNLLYAKAVKLMGDRSNASGLDFSEILTEEVETELKEAATISMGTKMSELDHVNITGLCNQVLSFAEYRVQLFDYIKSRMNTIAPNLTTLVGELVGVRLIAHGGSLFNLAMHPGSTIQILGAAKALFRALKTKGATPKYGIIYDSQLIRKAAPRNKGKISKSLASKIALAIRYDALGDDPDNTMGLESLAKLNARLRNLEGKELHSAGSAYCKANRKKGASGLITPTNTYNVSADTVLGGVADASTAEPMQTGEASEQDPVNATQKEEKKKKVKKEREKTVVVAEDTSVLVLSKDFKKEKEKTVVVDEDTSVVVLSKDFKNKL